MSGAWRPMRPADLAAVTALADRVHVEHPEAPAIFAERLDLFPSGCLALAAGAEILGYAVAHPGRIGAPPALNTLLGQLPTDADCLYLHDVALAPEARGHGQGASLLPHIVATARRHCLARLALIAVAGSEPFWQRQGFRREDAPALGVKLASYGTDAIYMARAVGG